MSDRHIPHLAAGPPSDPEDRIVPGAQSRDEQPSDPFCGDFPPADATAVASRGGPLPTVPKRPRSPDEPLQQQQLSNRTAADLESRTTNASISTNAPVLGIHTSLASPTAGDSKKTTNGIVRGHPVALAQMQIDRSPTTATVPDFAGEIEDADYFQTPSKGGKDHDDIEMNMASLTKGEQLQNEASTYFADDIALNVPKLSKDVPLGEDVYSLIFICPVNSAAFVFALYTHVLKMILMAFLLSDLGKEQSGSFGDKDATVATTQFLLLPVAIALQEDLIKVYMRVANMSYDIAITKDIPSAHKSKLFLSYFLQFLDGITSLSVNFIVMLKTDNILGIFLNFAALHFIQNIDNAAFSLAESGFLLKSIEEYCCIAKSSALPRRLGDFSTNYLDTILFTATYGLLFMLYFLATFSN